jgi:hypothetical protein
MAWRALVLLLFVLGARPAAAQSSGEEQARIVFLMPAVDASTRARLQDALYAQLSLVDAEMVVLEDAEGRDPEALAQAERAVAVLWLDTTAEDRWLLHILDIAQARKVVRRIDTRDSQRGAALEAVAVLAREASRGGPLLEEEPAAPEGAPRIREREPAGSRAEPGAAAATEPEAEPQPEAKPEPEAKPAPEAKPEPAVPEVPGPPPTLRLSLFYSGVDFAHETAFSHGVGLGARFDWRSGFFAGINATWAALAKPPNSLVVQRIPLGVAAGYRARALEGLWVDVELGLLVDLLFRSTRGAGADQTDGLRATAALAPRLRGEYRPLKLLGFFAGFGLDWALTRPVYKSQDPPRATLLAPWLIRPAIEAGVAFYP